MESTIAIDAGAVEWRYNGQVAVIADAVDANSSRVLLEIVKFSMAAAFSPFLVLAGASIWNHMRCLNRDSRTLLEYFHLPESIEEIELMPPDELSNQGRKLKSLSHRMHSMTARINDSEMLRIFCHKQIPEMREVARRLEAHADAFIAAEETLSPLFLTRRDQERLLEALANPPEPNDALRRAFARK